jgi:hypothetical protein
LRAAVQGFDSASAAERAAFTILTASGATIGFSRLFNYVRERRRHFPSLRSLIRHAYHLPGGGVRVHHFLPGMALSAMAGATAILLQREGRELWLGVPFGIGTGLTLDEVAFLIELDNPYWRTQRLALLEAGVALAGAAALAARFVAAGRDLMPDTRSTAADADLVVAGGRAG